jgi:hypothetical protein
MLQQGQHQRAGRYDKTLSRSPNEEQSEIVLSTGASLLSLEIKRYTNTFCHSYSTSHVLPFPHDEPKEQYEVWSLDFNDPRRRRKKTSQSQSQGTGTGDGDDGSK